jgi:hypothetical protein
VSPSSPDVPRFFHHDLKRAGTSAAVRTSDGLRQEGLRRVYLPCCWEALAAIARIIVVEFAPPSHGGPPPRARLAAGTFSCGRWSSRPKNCGSRLLPPPSVPHAGQSGPQPDNWISKISVRLFVARTLAPLPCQPWDRLLVTSVEKSNIEHEVWFSPQLGWKGSKTGDLYGLVGQFRSAGGLVS